MAEPSSSSHSSHDASPSATPPQGALSGAAGRRPFFLSRWMLVGIVAVLALTSIGVAYAATVGQGQVANVCGALSSARHGVPCDIPLPPNSAFISSSSGTDPDGSTYTQWVFSVAQTPAQLRDFYLTQLHASGWPCVTIAPHVSGVLMYGGKKSDRSDQQVSVVADPSATSSTKFAVRLFQHAPWPSGAVCS